MFRSTTTSAGWPSISAPATTRLISRPATNSVSVTNVESINTSDFVGNTAGISNDTLTLLNDVNGITVNLQLGTNTLNLAAGTNALTEFNIQQINGTSSDDQLTLQNQTFGTTIDLGAGNDSLQLADGGNSVTVNNIENVIGGNGNDGIVVAGAVGTTTVTGGLGQDFITAGAGTTDIRFTTPADSAASAAATPSTTSTPPTMPSCSTMSPGLAGAIHFVGFNGTLDGHGQSEAVLNGNTLQIDVNGDGVIGAGDMEVQLNGLTGSLTDANFIATGITTVDHAPTNIDLAGSIVAENSPVGAFVGLLTSTDQDAGDTATYSLTDSAGGAFAINGSTLVINGPIDYETTPTEQVTVRVTNSGGLSLRQELHDRCHQRQRGSDRYLAVRQHGGREQRQRHRRRSSVRDDPDAGDTDHFALLDDAGGRFLITAGGDLVVNGPLDFETAPTEQVTVRVTNSGGLSFDKTFTIGITDVNEAPTAVILSNQVLSTPENGGNIKVADIAVTDDALGNDVLSLSGADAASFGISTAPTDPSCISWVARTSK